MTVPPTRTRTIAQRLANAYITQLRQHLPTSALRQLDQLAGATPQQLERLRVHYPAAPEELLALLRRTDGTCWEAITLADYPTVAAAAAASGAPGQNAATVAQLLRDYLKNMKVKAQKAAVGNDYHLLYKDKNQKSSGTAASTTTATTATAASTCAGSSQPDGKEGAAATVASSAVQELFQKEMIAVPILGSTISHCPYYLLSVNDMIADAGLVPQASELAPPASASASSSASPPQPPPQPSFSINDKKRQNSTSNTQSAAASSTAKNGNMKSMNADINNANVNYFSLDFEDPRQPASVDVDSHFWKDEGNGELIRKFNYYYYDDAGSGQVGATKSNDNTNSTSSNNSTNKNSQGSSAGVTTSCSPSSSSPSPSSSGTTPTSSTQATAAANSMIKSIHNVYTNLNYKIVHRLPRSEDMAEEAQRERNAEATAAATANRVYLNEGDKERDDRRREKKKRDQRNVVFVDPRIDIHADTRLQWLPFADSVHHYRHDAPYVILPNDFVQHASGAAAGQKLGEAGGATSTEGILASLLKSLFPSSKESRGGASVVPESTESNTTTTTTTSSGAGGSDHKHKHATAATKAKKAKRITVKEVHSFDSRLFIDFSPCAAAALNAKMVSPDNATSSSSAGAPSDEQQLNSQKGSRAREDDGDDNEATQLVNPDGTPVRAASGPARPAADSNTNAASTKSPAAANKKGMCGQIIQYSRHYIVESLVDDAATADATATNEGADAKPNRANRMNGTDVNDKNKNSTVVRKKEVDMFCVVANDFGDYLKYLMSEEYEFTEELDDDEEYEEDEEESVLLSEAQEEREQWQRMKKMKTEATAAVDTERAHTTAAAAAAAAATATATSSTTATTTTTTTTTTAESATAVGGTNDEPKPSSSSTSGSSSSSTNNKKKKGEKESDKHTVRHPDPMQPHVDMKILNCSNVKMKKDTDEK